MNLKNIFIYLCYLFSFVISCEEKISDDQLTEYKSTMDVRLGHLEMP